jgi:hypothetical protein
MGVGRLYNENDVDEDQLFDFIWVRDLCELVERFDTLDGRTRDAVYKTKATLSHVAAKHCGLAPDRIEVGGRAGCGQPYVGQFCPDVARVLGVQDRLMEGADQHGAENGGAPRGVPVKARRADPSRPDAARPDREPR